MHFNLGATLLAARIPAGVVWRAKADREDASGEHHKPHPKSEILVTAYGELQIRMLQF